MDHIFAEWAFTEAGWQNNLLIDIDQQGRIDQLTVTQTPPGKAYRTGVLLPALSNVHSHSFQRAMAGLTEQRSHSENDSFWSWRSWMYRFVRHLSPDDIRVIAAQVQMEMLEAGYASVGEFHYLHHDISGEPYSHIAEMAESISAAADLTGIGLTLLPVLYQQGGCDGRPLNESQHRFGNSLDRFQRLHEASSRIVRELSGDSVCGVALHSLRAVETDALAFYGKAKNYRPMHIHIAEQQAEIDEVSSAFGTTPVQWLMDNCNVNKHWCLIHATHLTDQEVSAIATSNAVVGLCPVTEANLGDGIFKGKKFKHAGGQFGIGSDSNVRIALSEELRLYEYTQRLQHQQRTVLAEKAGSNGRYLYESAAVGGAQAIGRDCGKIAVGRWADLVSLDSGATAMIGRKHDEFLDSWIFAADDSLVCDVWSAGRHMVKEGRHLQHSQISTAFAGTMQRLLNN